MTPTEQIDTKELRKLAEAATPGPWIAGSPIPGLVRFLVADCGPIGKVYPADQKPSHGTTSMDDAKFIAAANPAAILALLDERDALKQRLAHAQMAADAEAKFADEWRERALRAERRLSQFPNSENAERAESAASSDLSMLRGAEARQLRVQVADLLDRLERAEADNEQLRATMCADSLASRAEAAAGAVPEGFKLVPITSMPEDAAKSWAWEQVQRDCDDSRWTVGESGTYYGFFLQGWNYRKQYESQLAAAPSAPVAAQAEPVAAYAPIYRKATTELSLPELAEQFAAVAELGGDYTLSSGVCAMLHAAMTTPPAPMQEAGSGWISVAERLPALGEPVIVYRPTAALTQDAPIRVLRYTGRETESWQGIKHGFQGICHPTHWMPLPDAPRAIATSKEEA